MTMKMRHMTNLNENFRIPEGINPKHYSLSLSPDLSNFSYTGKVDISLEVLKDSDAIVFHSSELEYRSVSITQDDFTTKVDLKNVVLNEEEETARVSTAIKKGKAHLHIDFSGTINDKMRGFYRSSFKDKGGKSHTVGCTQFESTDARKAFPCWDEPLHKATFDLDITAPKDFVVLSNTPVESEKSIGEQVKVKFERTPIMSTYLLAWFIGEYAFEQELTSKGTKIRIYTPREKLADGSHALSVAKDTLEFFERYFEIDYPLKKLDMVAISDFVNGAMENWGLVTYRDTAIYSNAESSSAAKEWVTSVVAHELAHQWFGNLVTMQWWSELWLNEGFATFMQTLANDKLFPEYKSWVSFVSEKLDMALDLDSLESSHPVEVPIKHAREIDQVFDVISYKKGASVLRMLYEYIGDNAFKLGLKNYLTHYRYNNSDSDGLWKFLEESSGKDITSIMHLFTRKIGFPMIEVSKVGEEKNIHTFKLKQSRFLKNGREVSDSEKTMWKIPIKVDIGGKISWILMESETLEIDYDIPDFRYVLFNSGATGFFRTLHSYELIQGLKDSIVNSEISESDRFMLLSDMQKFWSSGKASSDSMLSLLKVYDGETDETVWGSVVSLLLEIKRVVYKSPIEQKFFDFAIALTSKIHSDLGTKFSKDDDERTKKLRAKIIGIMATCKDKKTIEFLRSKFTDYTKYNEEIEADLYSSVVGNAVKHGGEKEFETVKKLSESESDPSKKNSALYALGKASEPAIIDKALQYILSGKVRDQDTFILFSAVSANPKGTKKAWEFFKKNYKLLREKYTHDSLFSRFVGVVSNFEDEESITEAEAFFESVNTKGYDKKLNQHLEKARLFIKMKKREYSNIETWLEMNQR